MVVVGGAVVGVVFGVAERGVSGGLVFDGAGRGWLWDAERGDVVVGCLEGVQVAETGGEP